MTSITRAHRRQSARAALLVAGLAAVALPGAAMANPARHHAPAVALHHLAPPTFSGIRAGVAQLPPGIERAGRQLYLSVGEGELINLPTGVSSIWTSNPNAADVYVNSNHQIHLFGKVSGDSTVFATSPGGAVVWSAQVTVAGHANSMNAMLRAAFPEDDVHLTMSGSLAVISGTVLAPIDSSQIETFVKSGLNSGAAAGAAGAAGVQVINRLKTATPLQVHLRVRIAEVSRSLLKSMQSNLSSSNYSNGFQYGVGRGNNFLQSSTFGSQALGVGVTPNAYQSILANATPTNPLGLTLVPQTGISASNSLTTLASQFKLGPLGIIAALNIGETAGLVTTLAEPDLTALSGETADFLAGGSYPIPVSSGLGQTSVEFKDYGVSLSFTPTVLADGNIMLHVRPEVSELDTSNAVTLNGYSVPGLTSRHAETTVEMGSGQSMMIAGLLSNNANHTIQKMPGAGDIPVLGNLFKSTSFQKGESELVIVITPYLVKPVNDGDVKLPTDGLQDPDDVKRVLGNMLTDGKSGGTRPGPTVGTVSGDAASAGATTGAANPHARAAAASQAQPGFSLN